MEQADSWSPRRTAVPTLRGASHGLHGAPAPFARLVEEQEGPRWLYSPAMDVVIRPASVGEAGQILDLQRLCYQSEAAIYDDWSIPPMTQTLPELLEEYEDHEVLVAGLGGES